jgi:hypothetical protein
MPFLEMAFQNYLISKQNIDLGKKLSLALLNVGGKSLIK